MSHARETTLTFFVMYIYLSPLKSSRVNLLLNIFFKVICYLYSVDCFHIW